MTSEELLRRLAVLIFTNDAIDLDERVSEAIAADTLICMKRRDDELANQLDDVNRQWEVLMSELWAYLPAPTITPEGLRQLELGEGAE